jgi:hypothetical protein
VADLSLTKTCDPADFARLEEELAIVDRRFGAARPQHEMRRWEYALALHALTRWQEQYTSPLRAVYDVGGAGSPFRRMVEERMQYSVMVIDPDVAPEPARPPCTLAELFACHTPRVGQAVFCLSVLEHVDDLEEFCYHLACLVAPGGLLFLTMDYCNDTGTDPEDLYHFHWMRQRIFNPYTLGALTHEFGRRDFHLFGTGDLAWHDPQVYDYTFASLCLVKRP